MVREMKDSGIEWLGKIPRDWEIRKLKTCILQRDSGAWGNEANGNEGDTICLRIADFDYARFRFKDTEEILLTKRNYNKETIKSLILQKTDIVIEKSGGGEKTPVGRTVIFDKDYEAVYANFCDRLRCQKFVLPWFMQYIFAAFYLNGYVWNYIKQTTGIQNLDLTAMLSSEKMALPLLTEQQKIIDFLNLSCMEIDNVIEKTRTSIEEYKKLKQTIITQAVTKGVRGDREMKDSGIEWIGEIPADWEVVKMKNLGKCRNGLTYSPDNLVSKEEGTLVLRSSNIKDGKLSFVDNVYVNSEIKNDLMVKAGDILICSRNGSRALIGKNALIPEDLNASFGAFMMIFRCQAPKYVHMILNSAVFSYYLGTFLTSTINQLTADNFNNMKIVYCGDKFEQKEITNYLDKKCAEIDTLIAKKKQIIVELENYKKSVIYEYVTGKKEVPCESVD